MKKVLVITILLSTLLLAACKATISESAMETAVSQVILTSSASEAAVDASEETEAQQQPEVVVSNEELEAAQEALDQAGIQLTEQADQIANLQGELEALYPLLTPTITLTPFDTPTPAATATATPRPTATEFSLPYYQKYVTPITNAPLFTYKNENDAGYPIMLKTEPVIKFVFGDVFIVDTNKVRADGGAVYYLVVGPKNAGYYVLITDVQDYKE